MDVINFHDAIRKNYVFDIRKNINQSIKNKAMLSFKYDDLNYWVTFVQIGIIFISTGLTVMNSIKSYYNMSSQVIDVLSILFTAFIGLIMAVYRFLKMDERKEGICNLSENYTGIINKFNKLLHKMDNYVITEENVEEWNKIVSNYQEEVLDNYLTIRETFDCIFDYQDIIYYKNKFKKLYLEHEMINNEIETIQYFKKAPISRYSHKSPDETSGLCANMKPSKKIKYDKFIEDNEEKYLEHVHSMTGSKSRNQDLYREHILKNKSLVINSLPLDEEEHEDTGIAGDAGVAEVPVNPEMFEDATTNESSEDPEAKKPRIHVI